MEILIRQKEIQDIVARLAEQINKDYKGKELVVIGVLKGSVFFLSDLLRKIDMPLEIDFIEVSSYEGTQSRGVVCIKKDITIDIQGKDVLLIEDIIDTGATLFELKKYLLNKKPRSLKVAVFIDKLHQRRFDVHADYAGKAIPNIFIVGYGCDYNGKYRNFPEIRIFQEERYEK